MKFQEHSSEFMFSWFLGQRAGSGGVESIFSEILASDYPGVQSFESVARNLCFHGFCGSGAAATCSDGVESIFFKLLASDNPRE